MNIQDVRTGMSVKFALNNGIVNEGRSWDGRYYYVQVTWQNGVQTYVKVNSIIPYSKPKTI